MLRQAVRAGVGREDLIRQPMPEKYMVWLFPIFYAENVQYLHQLYLKE
jgi:hypothetical protein